MTAVFVTAVIIFIRINNNRQWEKLKNIKKINFALMFFKQYNLKL